MIADISVENAKNTQIEIQNSGARCEIFIGDLTIEENCKQMVEDTVNAYGRLDIIVTSAGALGHDSDLETEFSTENFTKTMKIDLESTFMAVKYSYKECAKNGTGLIITIASLAALKANGPLVYATAKGAIRSFSKNLAKKIGPMGVRVNTIYPGFILTEMTKPILDMPELLQEVKDGTVTNTIGLPEDVGNCAVYLASDAARYITGQDFVIDGGTMIL